jgi:MFS family permease
MGFSVQAILRRIPIAIAPIAGGILIAQSGVLAGIRIGLVTSILLALVTLVLVSRIQLVLPETSVTGLTGVWRSFPLPLRRLLLSDIFIRTCEGLVDVFLVLYALNVVGIDAPEFGVLIAVQVTTSIVCYLPAARLADRLGRKPFVIATFLAFSLFPLAVIAAQSFTGLLAAFVVGGLREIGEPARKALIVDLVSPGARARGVGLYYLVRSLVVAPAATIGAMLWRTSPTVPFVLASAIGLAGTLVFALTVRREHAG